MQTFLPYPNFSDSASCLDNKRLGNQRNEAWILYQSITNGNKWSNHPASKMWKGYERSLLEYNFTICISWMLRKFKDTVLIKVLKEIFNENIDIIYPDIRIKYPPWLGDERLHSSHRSNLLRKDRLYYSQFLWKEEDNIPYYWPTV